MNPYIQQKVEEFKEKVKDLRVDDFTSIGETPVREFGYKIKDDNRSIWTIVDFGNIEKFLSKALQDTWDEAISVANNANITAVKNAYQIGRKEMLEEVMGCFPKDEGMNLCIDRILSNMKKKGLIT